MRKSPLLILVLLALLPLIGWWTHGLFDLDEGFYGAVAAEMNRRGEWITPYFNGRPWYEKPILLYWLAKPSMALFGFDFGPRLPSVLAGLASVVVVFRFGKKWFGEQAAALACIALASSILWSAVARQMMTDTLLALCYAGAVLAFWEALSTSPSPQRGEGTGVRGDAYTQVQTPFRTPRPATWMAVAGSCLGASVLAKGPVGILLFAPLAIWIILALKPPRLGAKAWLLFFGCLVAVTASWYLPAYLKDGQLFVQKFLIEQNLNRFTGGDTAHTLTDASRFIFFVPILLLGFAPWSFYLPKTWPRRDATEVRKYLAASALIPFLFFSVSSAKLVHYILPCFIPLALLVASGLTQARDLDWRKLRPGMIWLFFVAVLINVGLPIYYQSSGQAEIHGIAKEIKPDLPVVVYQMPRRQASQGTGKPKIQETSHPSLAMVLNRVYVDSEFLEARGGKLYSRPRPDGPEEEVPLPAVILTREGRIPNPEALLSGGVMLAVTHQGRYARFYASRSASDIAPTGIEKPEP